MREKISCLCVFFLVFLLVSAISAGCIQDNGGTNGTTGLSGNNASSVSVTLNKSTEQASPAPPRTPQVTGQNTSNLKDNDHECPAFLINPPEFSCPREMQPWPETHIIADPNHPTQKEIDAIPVDFPGVDRMTLINAAIADPCVKEFLKSGGVIEGITDQPRPFLNQTETVRWPPTLMADRRVNCTDLRVFFDLDPSAGRVTRIWGETR